MVIAGFQPLSLLDYPGKSCSIVFTQGCPFRCPYCHNPELISICPPCPSGRRAAGAVRPKTSVTEASVLTYLRQHIRMLDGVCITGGEPTIQVGLRAFIKCVKELGLLVKLDTNGVHPTVIRELIADHLVDYFAMDLKAPWEQYQHVVRVSYSGSANAIANCRETFGIIQTSGVDHEFRTTICPGVHTAADFFEMAGYLKDGETYFIQEMQFKKTLVSDLPRDAGFHAADLAVQLRERFPCLTIESR